ncbi:MAG: 5-formyltetrahydrofolate cyclo-ligase [Bacillota bacterium]
MQDTLHWRKEEARAVLLKRRDALIKETVKDWGETIQESVRRLPLFQGARIIMFYAPFRNEVETEGLIKEALAAGKRVVFPVADKVNRELVARQIMRYPDDLTPGAYNILEPLSSCPVIAAKEVDLIFVPGAAFDPQGYRLGYGGGYYDRFLPRTKGISIGLAYHFQLLVTVFPEEHDWPVNFVVTEDVTIETNAEARRRK